MTATAVADKVAALAARRISVLQRNLALDQADVESGDADAELLLDIRTAEAQLDLLVNLADRIAAQPAGFLADALITESTPAEWLIDRLFAAFKVRSVDIAQGMAAL